jgi:hypothetical protein
MAGRPKKIKIEESTVVPEVTSTGANGNITEQDILETVIGDIDELAPVDGESAEHKRIREIYVASRKNNPIAWNNDKTRLLAILKTL